MRGATNFPQNGEASAVEYRGVNGFRVHCPFDFGLGFTMESKPY